MSIQFYELAIGARFFFLGRRYVKLAMSMTEGENRVGHIFLGETEVEADSEPLLLPPEEVARWEPLEKHWSVHFGPAPGQGERKTQNAE